jgi:hypothetical protein
MLDLRKNLIERRMIELDPTLAKHYLKFNVYETQRTIRPLHVLDLADKMEKGLFRFGEVAFACRNGAGDLLVNGQHVCSAVIESGATVPCLVEKFKISTDRELSELFRQFEILPRSLSDMVRVEANSLAVPWPVRVSSLIVSAAALEYGNQKALHHGSGGGMGSKSPSKKALSKEGKVKLLGKYLKEGSFLYNIIGDPGSCPHICKAVVALMIFKTWRIDKGSAEIFWKSVRDGELLKKDSAEMKIRNWLLFNAPRNVKNRRVISNHEIAYRIAQAWNAFRSGSNTNLTYYPDKNIPKLK